jgi:hypothetical protein
LKHRGTTDASAAAGDEHRTAVGRRDWDPEDAHGEATVAAVAAAATTDRIAPLLHPRWQRDDDGSSNYAKNGQDAHGELDTRNRDEL